MKKSFLFGLIAAALGFAACSSDDDALLSQQPQRGMMTLNATVQQSVDTRATLDVSNSSWAFDFEETKDKLEVTNTALSGTYYTFTKGATDFTSTTATPTSSPATWYAYYPSNTVTLTAQSGTAADIADKYYALAGATSSATTGETGLNIDLSAQVAILKIVNAGGSIDINVKNSATTWVTGLKASDGSFSVTTSTTKASLLNTSTAGTYYVAVPAGIQLAIKDGDTVIKSTKEAGLVAGKYYTVGAGTVTWTKALQAANKSAATSISIETGVTTKPASVTQELNTDGTLWEVYDSETKTLRIQTPAQKIIGHNTFTSNQGLFRGFTSVTGISGLGNLDMRDVTDMSYMFLLCKALTTLDLSSLNTSKVTNMNSMFYGCAKLTTLNLSSFNTSNVTDMSYVFNYCSELTSLDLSNFNTSKVTTMFKMFSECRALTSLDLSNFNTVKVTTMHSMFNQCYKLKELKLSDNFKIASTTATTDMFKECGKDATSSGNGQGVIYGVNADAIKDACKASTNWNDNYMRFNE